MKAKLKAKIVGLEHNVTARGRSNVEVPGLTKLSLTATGGKVDTSLNNAQFTTIVADLFVKQIIANDIKIGATITITVSDEETEE